MGNTFVCTEDLFAFKCLLDISRVVRGRRFVRTEYRLSFLAVTARARGREFLRFWVGNFGWKRSEQFRAEFRVETYSEKRRIRERDQISIHIVYSNGVQCSIFLSGSNVTITKNAMVPNIIHTCYIVHPRRIRQLVRLYDNAAGVALRVLWIILSYASSPVQNFSIAFDTSRLYRHAILSTV